MNLWVSVLELVNPLLAQRLQGMVGRYVHSLLGLVDVVCDLGDERRRCSVAHRGTTSNVVEAELLLCRGEELEVLVSLLTVDMSSGGRDLERLTMIHRYLELYHAGSDTCFREGLLGPLPKAIARSGGL